MLIETIKNPVQTTLVVQKSLERIDLAGVPMRQG
jgi:hypothetical protein